MRIDAIELHVGEPEFPYNAIRQLEAKSEAKTAFSAAPTHETVNAQLRALAAQVGADAIINIQYQKGISMTSWNSLKGTGLAVKRVTTGTTARTGDQEGILSQRGPTQTQQSSSTEPLKSSDNNHVLAIIVGIVSGLMLLGMIFGS